MKKVLTSVAFITCLALSAFADRAMPGLWQTKKLADGREVRVELKGDEHVHFTAIGQFLCLPKTRHCAVGKG